MFSAAKTSGPSGYNINNSLRFRGSASAYLNRTPASATNRQNWTWSGWIKRGNLVKADDFRIFSARNISDYTLLSFRHSSAATPFALYLEDSATGTNIITTQVFRDPSAWYHIVIAIDTTQATTANRVKIYINGSQVTAFSTATYPTQNGNTWMNNTVPHGIGIDIYETNQFFDGYMAEINFIAGQQLTPSSFGSTNATTGVWQPKKYTGSYGTNGYYLPFSDIGLTSGSNTGLGKDFSGNSNYWTTNNISVTAGTTYDAMTDSPTLTSATVANYAVMSPIDFITANGTISSANLNWASSTNVCGNRATIGSTSGKWYWEAIGSSVTSGTIGGRFAFTGSDTIAVEQDKFGMYWHPTSGIARIVNGTNTYVTSAYTYTNSDVLALALDLDNNISYWYKNGVLQYTYDFSSFSTIGSRVFFPYVWNASSGTPSWVYNFGQRPFTYTPPTGFKALNTFNLPTSTIVKGNTVMDATLYTGNGTSQTITTAASFKPDLVWIKGRSYADFHTWFDTVRGATKSISSDLTTAEVTRGTALTAFTSTGFTVGSDTLVNYNGQTTVAWQWQAGQGTTSSNTSGSITSTVSVNTTAGFSIVTYTGNATANATVGHGLGVTPRFFVVKVRSTTGEWLAYHVSTGKDGFMQLQSTAAFASSANYWGTTGPTSTTFQINGGGGVNNNGSTYVAYCWAEIAGFSAFGSYTGNGSADGPFVFTGFRPKFVLTKRTNGAGDDWTLFDTARNTYNLSTAILRPNTSQAELSSSMDLLSNGFKWRQGGGNGNESGGTYIFMAFAENPFKNALAR